MSTITTTQYETVCAIIDHAKNDDRLLNTGEYADEIIAALGIELVTTPQELTFRTSASRPATSEEVSNLLYGTGALSMEWWGGCDSEERDGVTGYLLEHATEDSPDDGSTPGRTWLSEQRILDAAAWAVEQGYSDEDRMDIIGESIGYFDASAGDVVLQYAVFSKVVFG
ncbi:hypothetical protein SEA_FIZZLES_82 [Microbacterium phage Fizzles]|nr:hypothetical protein SEA_FIZZLES_82 [Microbacterium phage Fizzles]